ncbi:MAG: hypothetical protein JO209_03855 [Acidisphaera sp.]|nr:hypothetical protein [Acidisphaera sp.]
MSDSRSNTAAPGPPIAPTVQEVRGFFASDAALQDAIGRLTLAGFDRADLSLPAAVPAGEATPEQGAADPHTEPDDRQVRTLHASMAGAGAALLAAGVVAATGGAAAPAVAAAAAAGLAAGGAAHLAGRGADAEQHEQREAAAAQGHLVLTARVADNIKRGEAETAMRAAGATRVVSVVRA